VIATESSNSTAAIRHKGAAKPAGQPGASAGIQAMSW
jgi:hypothetical protein